MVKLSTWLVAAVLLSAPALSAQDRGSSPDLPRKQATAVRVSSGAIRVDGRLDEQVWRQATPIADFVQKEPDEGTEPTNDMEVRFLYDDSALYVGARMYTRESMTIQAPLGRRDDSVDQAEHLLVSLDTFLDRRTAYTFGVTASGVRLDRYHSRDDENSFDTKFNPVWEAKALIDGRGWTAELWIPFSQLRFNDRPEQTWGLNIKRFIPTLEEADYWVLVPRTVRAWSSRFGELRGIEGVHTRTRLEALPYLAGSATLTGAGGQGNPFDDGRSLASRAGADLKIGLGPNLTLDVTVNPDFGQVDADPAEVNLTAFETRFPEQRPFFTEGAQLLPLSNHGSGSNSFYSRRIGARPVGRASGDFVDYPSGSTILAAAKVTGRLQSGTSLGVLSAVTDDEFARISNRDVPGIESVRVAPRTFYGLAHVQQEFGPSASTASVMVAGVHRDLAADDPLASRLSRSLFLAGSDTLLRFKGGEYEVSLAGLGTFVSGEAAAIERLQRSSAHYAQRPDRAYARLDPTRTRLSGYSAAATFSRTGGAHWLWNARVKIDSPGFEPNDIGNLKAADGIQPSLTVRYRETRPGRVFRGYSVGIRQSNEFNFGGDRQSGSVRPYVDLTWKNFWTTYFSVTRTMKAQDAWLTRGGPLMETPRGWSVTASVGNSVAAQMRWEGDLTSATTEDGGKTRRASWMFSFRPGPRWRLSIQPSYEYLVDSQQYVTTLDGGRPETFGSRYIFAYIERSTWSAQCRLSFTLKPDVNLDAYVEPFTASGRYYDYGELLAPGSGERITYGTSGTTVERQDDGSRHVTVGDSTFTLRNRDFNVRSFRSNVVLHWEWRPGSTLYLVWQQDRSISEPIGSRVGPGDLFRSITAPGANTFLVKTSFWVPLG